MEIEYTGRQIVISKKLRTQAATGLERIAKITGASANVHVVLTSEKYRHCAEITVQTRHLKLVAVCEATDMETALHEALSKVEKQAIRHKKRTITQKRRGRQDGQPGAGAPRIRGKAAVAEAALEEQQETPRKKGNGASSRANGQAAVPIVVHSFPLREMVREPHVVRSADSVALRPMTIDEAVKEAEFRDRDVFVFRDKQGDVKVLHRTRDGRMELIEAP